MVSKLTGWEGGHTHTYSYTDLVCLRAVYGGVVAGGLRSPTLRILIVATQT